MLFTGFRPFNALDLELHTPALGWVGQGPCSGADDNDLVPAIGPYRQTESCGVDTLAIKAKINALVHKD